MKIAIYVIAITAIVATAANINTVAGVLKDDSTVKVEWVSPCGEKEVLGHRTTPNGQTQYVCAQ
tara:strand:- start:982 stop:1173 length:192 start_codon:yes stop_codon:yes gene_type:complete